MKTMQAPHRSTLAGSVAVVISLLLAQSAAIAQAPGQDAIIFATAPVVSPGSGIPERRGKGLDAKQDMSISLKAKIARYTALSVSKGEDSKAAQIAEQRTESAGFNKTCVQDIASNPATGGLSTGRYGPRSQDQVVVLRGDFINVCR